MAINKIITTPKGTGNDVEHHVLTRALINKTSDLINVQMKSYKSADNYNAEDYRSEEDKLTLSFEDVPANVKVAALAFVTAVEEALLDTPTYTGGTRVNDDGTPIT